MEKQPTFYRETRNSGREKLKPLLVALAKSRVDLTQISPTPNFEGEITLRSSQ